MTTNLTAAQRQQVLSCMAETTASKTLTAQQLIKLSADQKQALVDAGIITVKQAQTGATITLTQAELKKIIADEAILTKDKQLILSAFGVTEANLTEASSWEILGKSAGKALASLLTNPYTYLVAGLVATVVAVKNTSKAIEEVRDKAQELGDTFNTSKSEIKGYKTQVQDLYKTINDSGSSVEDITTARQTLMSIQDELIDKFGDEKETIDLVTQAINGQSSALDTLIGKQWQETKNKFNESDFWNDYANWTGGYSNNIDRMVDEMENAWGNIKMSTSDYFGGEYDDVIKRLEDAGWEYNSSSETFVKGGSVEDLYEEILEIQDLVGEDMPDNFLESLTKDANELKGTLDKYKDIWDNYILNDKIFADETLADSWKEVNDAYTKYQNAVTSGDKSAIEEATAGFAASINEVLNDENVDDSIKDYFKDMYPALYREVEKWEFKTNIIPEFDISGLQGKTQADILGMLQTDGTQDGEDVFNSIVASAIKYGLIVDDNAEGVQKVLDLLVEWGILQGTISDNTSDLDKMTVSLSELEKTSDNIGKLSSAFKELSDNGYITTKTLGEIKTAVGMDDETFEQYKNTLLNAKAGTSEFNQIMSDLTYKILDNTFKKDGLVDATEDEITAVLRECNVVNAEAVARSYLSNTMSNEEKDRARAIISKYNLNELSEDSVNALLAEAGAENISRNEMIKLTASTIAFNNTGLDTSTKVAQLKELALYAGVASEAQLAALDPNILGRRIGNQGGSVVDYVYNKLFGSMTGGITFTAPKYSGSSSSSGSSSEKNEVLDNYLEGAEWQYSAHQDDAKYINDLQWALENLAKTDEEIFDLEQKIEQARKDSATNTIKDLEHEIELKKNLYGEDYDATEKYKKIQEIAHNEANRLRGLGFTDESNEIQDLQNQWWDAQKNINDIANNQFDDKINDIEHQIELLENLNEQDEHYGDDSTRLTRYNRTQEINDYYKQLQEEVHKQAEELRKQGYTDDRDEIQELQKQWWEFENAIRDNISNMTDMKITAYTEQLEDEIEALDLQYEKESAIIDALKQQNDLKKQIRDKQAELNADLDASKHMEEWLDEDTRKALFNEEDYSALSEELSKIDGEINRLYKNYRNEINRLDEDEWYKQEEITAQFQARLDVQMESYELLEKELEIAKKRTEYENIAKQRNTRVMVAGRWVMTADTSALQEASKSLATLENEKENLEITNAEEATIRGMEAINNATNTERLAIQNRIDMIEEMTELERKAYADRLLLDVLEGVKVTPTAVEVPSVEAPVAETQSVRYIGIDENGKLISESLPEGYSRIVEMPQSALGKALSSSTEFAQRILQTMPNPMSMMPKFTTPTIPNIQTSNMSNVTQYTFTGDISIENPIGDPNDLVHALATQVGQTFDVTKNMRK